MLYQVTDHNVEIHNVIAEDIDSALNRVSSEQGFFDHPDQCEKMGWPDSPFDIMALSPEGATLYWSKNEGEIVYRFQGEKFGDGQADSDKSPVYFFLGFGDGDADNVINLDALEDVST